MLKDLFKKKKEFVICEAMCVESDVWVYGLISYLNIDENNIGIFVYEEYLKKYFQIENDVVIKFIRNSSEYIIKGVVLKKESSALEQTIQIKLKSIQKFSNLRKNERFRFDSVVNIYNTTENTYSCHIDDISKEGLLITSTDEFTENMTYKMSINALKDKPIEFSGIIKRKFNKTNRKQYAIQIESIKINCVDALNELIFLLSLQKQKVTSDFKDFNRLKYGMGMQQGRLRI